MDNPFDITLYDRGMNFTGSLNDAAVSVTVKHNAIGTATLTVPINHDKLDLVDDQKGDRVVITYNGEHLLSGPVTAQAGQGPSIGGTVDVTVQDDLWLLWRMLGWPMPGAAIDAQGTKEDVRTGPAETVAKGFVSANLGHIIDPVDVMPDLARGANITARCRMKYLADVLIDPCTTAGIGLQVRQVDGRLKFDAYETTLYAYELSERSGTILSFDVSSAPFGATRAITGGPDEGTSREFRRMVSTDRETQLGYTIEQFVDANQADSHAAQDTEGQNALDAATRKVGFKVELSETTNFRYGGTGIHVGDRVPVNLAGQSYTEVLTETKLELTSDRGLVVTPTVGELVDDPDVDVNNFIAAAKRRFRELGTR